MSVDRRLTQALIAISMLLAAVIAALVFNPAPDVGLLRPDDRELVAQGADIYAQMCAICHGENLEGQVESWRSAGPDGLLPAPPHDETGHTWHHHDTLLFAITKYGVADAANLPNYLSAMPAYEGMLSDDEIISVLSYIKSNWPEEIISGHDALNQRMSDR